MFKVHKQSITRQSDRESRFYNFLKDHPIGVLSTISPDHEPHGTVIYFNVDNNLEITFLTRADTKKHNNIKLNNHVMLTVFDPKKQSVAQINGVAYEVEDSYKVNGIAGAILASSLKTGGAGLPPISKLNAGPYVGYTIVPRSANMALFASKDPGEYSDLFESIESFDLEV